MTRERIYLFDTTLRDGQQTPGVDFSLEDKIAIAAMLDNFGIDYVEGGYPGANPTDTAFFSKKRTAAGSFVAFGMTKRAGVSASNDPGVAALVQSKADAVCYVAKSWDYHVKVALGISNEDNLECIADSIAAVAASGKEALLDCEHFFDGYKANPDYALSCAKAAHDAGARWVVLCDTNGGTLPKEVEAITRAVIEAGIPGDRLGIHTHNDTGNAVANALAAVDAGARQIQGTLNGLGERCGNANLITLIPTLMLKEPYRSAYETGVPEAALVTLTRVSRQLDDILNRVPAKSAPYVGGSAFVHKAGLHASAILKDPSTYEHIDPAIVGNERVVPMSNQAGQSNLRARLDAIGIALEKGDPRLAEILDAVKEREDQGYAYDSAEASFELVARRILGTLPGYFDVERYRVISERRRNAKGRIVVESEAMVAVRFSDGVEKTSFYKNEHAQEMQDNGPVNALWQALQADLGPYQGAIEPVKLTDFKVRITQGGTEAVTRVIIDFTDGRKRWSTVGVSANIVDASFAALLDAVVWKLLSDGLSPA